MSKQGFSSGMSFSVGKDGLRKVTHSESAVLRCGHCGKFVSESNKPDGWFFCPVSGDLFCWACIHLREADFGCSGNWLRHEHTEFLVDLFVAREKEKRKDLYT